MKAYLSIKFQEDHGNRELVDAISAALEAAGIASVVIARDYERWGEVQLGSSHALMKKTFEEIDSSDLLIVEFSEKGVGLGIEAGYAHAHGKPIAVIAKRGSEISSTMEGIAQQVMFYADPRELDFSELRSLLPDTR